MKKKGSRDLNDDLRPDYGPELFLNMKPNRFAGRELTFKGRRAAPKTSAKTARAKRAS